jgi:hypothetical protein
VRKRGALFAVLVRFLNLAYKEFATSNGLGVETYLLILFLIIHMIPESAAVAIRDIITDPIKASWRLATPETSCAGHDGGLHAHGDLRDTNILCIYIEQISFISS